MRDPVFSGRDVEDAVRIASRTLSLPASTLRYVVLDDGRPEGRGLSATEARIAVLLPSPAGAIAARVVAPVPSARGEDPTAGDERAGAAGIQQIFGAFARATASTIEARVGVEGQGVAVHVDGPGSRLFFDPDGATLAALEHVLERGHGRTFGGRRVRVQCEGYREYRDENLRAQAGELVAAVRADGQPRTTAPLNAYERRIVHLAVEDADGVVSYSVGEGAGRRVTVAPRAAADTPSAPDPARAEPFDARRYARDPEGGQAPELM